MHCNIFFSFLRTIEMRFDSQKGQDMKILYEMKSPQPITISCCQSFMWKYNVFVMSTTAPMAAPMAAPMSTNASYHVPVILMLRIYTLHFILIFFSATRNFLFFYCDIYFACRINSALSVLLRSVLKASNLVLSFQHQISRFQNDTRHLN